MTRTKALLMAALATFATVVATAAMALNPQPLPPMPRCSPYCATRTIPAWTSAPTHYSHRGR